MPAFAGEYDYLAPLDAHNSNGMQINGTMLGSSEFGSSVVNLVSGTDKYITDGHVVGFQNSAAAFTSQQIACPGTPPMGFDYCLQLKATTAVSSYASSDFAGYHYAIEALTFRRMMFGTANAQPLSVGFWIYATSPGTFVVALRNNVPNRTYPIEVTVNSANAWEFKTVVFPGDTSGTWQTISGTGAYFGMMFGAGSLYQGTANTWQAGNKVATSGLSNFFSSNNNVVCITGVIILPGNCAPYKEVLPRLMRDPIEDVRLWQRYWRSSFGVGVVPGTALGGGNMGMLVGASATYPAVAQTFLFGQRMRTTPTITLYDGAGTSGKTSYFASASWNNNGAISANPLNTQGFYIAFNIASANYYNFDYVADARLPVA